MTHQKWQMFEMQKLSITSKFVSCMPLKYYKLNLPLQHNHNINIFYLFEVTDVQLQVNNPSKKIS